MVVRISDEFTAPDLTAEFRVRTAAIGVERYIFFTLLRPNWIITW